MEIGARFWSKVDRSDPDGCWIWLAARAGPNRTDQYGSFWNGERNVGAHRFSYELANGPVPAGLDLDHLCRVRLCVRPDHLEPVTRVVNVRRRYGEHHCRLGHEYTEQNTYIDKNGWRACVECRRQAVRRWRQRGKLRVA